VSLSLSISIGNVIMFECQDLTQRKHEKAFPPYHFASSSRLTMHMLIFFLR